ncbi:MAG: hypothetical protein H0V82_11585 [Candidatus Protochlamydia sp.]|nr:hypothetical protein [Candidatus Protochlamydia sp.]
MNINLTTNHSNYLDTFIPTNVENISSKKFTNLPEETLSTFFQNSISGKFLSLKGVDLILNYLREKGAIQIPVETASGYTQLTEYIDRISKLPDGKYGLIFCSNPPHVTPILFEIEDGECTIVITDSFGLKGDSSARISKWIFDFTGTRSYIYTEQRQLSKTDCYNISIRDMVYMSKNKNFKSFVMDNSTDEQTECMISLHKLPIEMHKITQNHTILSDDELKTLIPSQKSDTGQITLKQAIFKYSEKGNLRAVKNFEKYETIISDFFKNSQDFQ